MQTKDMQFLAALRTAQDFLTANGSTLASVNAAGARKELDAAIDQIAALSVAQESNRINVTGQRVNEHRTAAAFRRKYIRPIVEISRARLPGEPSLANVTLPSGKANTTALVEKGKGIVDAVQPFAQVFIDAGLPQDFIAQLQAAAAQLVKVVTQKNKHRAGRSGATDGIGKEVRKARHAVRVLDSLVRAEVQLEEPLITEWRGAVRVIRGGHPASVTATVVASTPPATPNPASGAPTAQAA